MSSTAITAQGITIARGRPRRVVHRIGQQSHYPDHQQHEGKQQEELAGKTRCCRRRWRRRLGLGVEGVQGISHRVRRNGLCL